AVSILDKGWVDIDGKPIYSFAFFKVLRHLIKIIHRDQMYENEVLQKEAKINNIKLLSAQKGTYVEHIPLKQKYILTTLAMCLLQSTKSMDMFVKSNSIAYGSLRMKTCYSDIEPFFYFRLIEKYKFSIYSPTTKEIEQAITWMYRNGIPVSMSQLSKVFNIHLEARKRPDIEHSLINFNMKNYLKCKTTQA
ncbi:MAG: hypothetical protein ACQERD_12205, partial [Campylobacterota bacterium]